VNWSRIKNVFFFLLAGLFAFAPAWAADRYVTPPGVGTNNYPYTNWADAATNIQWAVNAATNGDTVWVTNGTYMLTNQISITNRIILKSMNGYSGTTVDGNYPNYTNLCFNMSGNSTVDGFTIKNGYASNGGGVYVATGKVYNCLITGNTATNFGGGLYGAFITVPGANYISNCYVITNIARYGGGFYGNGTIEASTIISNLALRAGGINMDWSSAGAPNFVSNCVIACNQATGDRAGGIYFNTGYSEMRNCIISNNAVFQYGGGAYLNAYGGGYVIVRDCIIVNNSVSSSSGKGGGLYCDQGGNVRQCLISGNRNIASPSGGGGIYADRIKNNVSYPGYIDSCTIVSNITSFGPGGGILVVGTNTANSVSNCVIWGNIATNAYENDIGGSNSPFWFVCASYTNFSAGQGNITNNPQFVDFNGGNYRLNANSPCINAGTNESWMTNSVDLDERQRIRYGRVDIGAYERIYNGTIYTIP